MKKIIIGISIGASVLLVLRGGWVSYQEYQYNQEQKAFRARINERAEVGRKFGVYPSGPDVKLTELRVNHFLQEVAKREKDAKEIKTFYKEILIPAGSFLMGCVPEDGQNCYESEVPAHKVKLTKDFYMMQSEVTQRLYVRLIDSNPSHFRWPNKPVEEVSSVDAMQFANKLNKMEGRETCYSFSIEDKNWHWKDKNCKGWRLPTEGEWAFAARGGENYIYAGSNNPDEVAWTLENSGHETQDVCSKKKNGYDLCDMSGNVSEWVWDWMEDYSAEEQVDPAGPSTGRLRVARGGSWGGSAGLSQVQKRGVGNQYLSKQTRGFRLVRNP